MTREDQIKQAAAEYAKQYLEEGRTNFPTQELMRAYRCGMRYADQHPISEECFCKDNLNYIQGLEDGKKLSPWISVEDRLPKNYQDVIVIDDENNVELDTMLDNYNKVWKLGNGKDYTHWMSIPPIEKGE